MESRQALCVGLCTAAEALANLAWLLRQLEPWLLRPKPFGCGSLSLLARLRLSVPAVGLGSFMGQPTSFWQCAVAKIL